MVDENLVMMINPFSFNDEFISNYPYKKKSLNYTQFNYLLDTPQYFLISSNIN